MRATVAKPRGGVKHTDVGHAGCCFEPTDSTPFFNRPRISLRCHDDGHARPFPPPRRLHRFKAAVHCRIEEFKQARLHPDHQCLALGIAETGVEFQYFWPLGREHQARIEHPLKGHLCPPHRMGGRHEDSRLDVREQVGIDERGGAVCPHATGIGPGVTVVGGLVILKRRKRDDRPAVGDGHDAHLDPIEPLLDQDAFGRCGKLFIAREAVERSEGRSPILADEHALACRQSVGFHDHRHVFAGLEVIAGPDHTTKLAEHRGRHVAAVHDLLAEQLASLKLCGLRCRAKDPQTCSRERIDYSGHERGFRTDHCEIDSPGLSQGHEGGDIVGGNCNVLGHGRRAGIARRHKYLGPITGQFPGDGMLPTAATNHQNTTRRRWIRAAGSCWHGAISFRGSPVVRCVGTNSSGQPVGNLWWNETCDERQGGRGKKTGRTTGDSPVRGFGLWIVTGWADSVQAGWCLSASLVCSCRWIPPCGYRGFLRVNSRMLRQSTLTANRAAIQFRMNFVKNFTNSANRGRNQLFVLIWASCRGLFHAPGRPLPNIPGTIGLGISIRQS